MSNPTMPLSFTHHGAVDGVTGSCHQLTLSDGQSVLVDWGPFQDAETSHQTHGPRGGHVELDGQRFDIRAAVHTLGRFSAHADPLDLLNFIGLMHTQPRQVQLVHGDDDAKRTLAALLRQRHPGVEVVVP